MAKTEKLLQIQVEATDALPEGHAILVDSRVMAEAQVLALDYLFGKITKAQFRASTAILARRAVENRRAVGVKNIGKELGNDSKSKGETT